MTSRTSIAVCYRSLQAIHDLRLLARRTTDRTLERLAAGLGGAMAAHDLRALIEVDGCRMSPEIAGVAHQALVLAATLPDDDFEAFRAATTILVADRLQIGGGTDDLFWHWDAFQAQYRTWDSVERAVLLHGFIRLQEEGLITLFDPPEAALICSESRTRIERGLTSLAGSGPLRFEPDLDAFPESLASLLLRAFNQPIAASAAANAWSRHALAVAALPAPVADVLQRGFRHLYESRTDWHPYAGIAFDPYDSPPPMLPLLSA